MNTSRRSQLYLLIKTLLVLVFTSFISLNAYSSTSLKGHSDTITFTGNIVNAPCVMSHDPSSSLRVGCLDEQSNMKTEYVDINKLSNTTKSIELSNQLGSYEFQWVNSSNKTGLIKVEYQ